jgi:hypothetical protein
MRILSRLSYKLLTLFGALLIAGCVVQPATMMSNPNPSPPPVRVEAIPKPPVSEEPLIWQPGHWDWEGTGYVWREGDWVKRAGHGTQWQDGYWATSNGVWVWQPAHWL